MSDREKLPVVKKNQDITPPPPPDPTYPVTEFIQWLKKRGMVKSLKLCKKKWESEGLDIEKILKDLNPLLGLYRSKGGEKVVKLEDRVWADKWMIHYKLEVPHHRHAKSMEKMISVTENKTKV